MKYFSIIVLILLSVNIFAQNIDINYYSTGAGRNITATYSKLIKNSEFGFGIGYNIGSIKQPDNQGNIYYKRLYPTKPIHYLNLNSFYNFYFFKKLSCIKPFLFYDLQIKYSTTRSSMYIIHDYDSTLNGNIPEENLLYRNFIEYFGPFLWVENSLGLGFKVNITENIYLKQNLGLGIHLIFGEDSRLLGQNPVWEFYGFINIGVGIKIKSP